VLYGQKWSDPALTRIGLNIVEQEMDAYSKLRPYTEIERCECDAVSGLLLVHLLTDNPIHCATCKNEVDPERLGLVASEVDEIASCFSVYGALYALWLDSGDYEAFAKEKLLDPKGQVNRAGMAVAERMSRKWPTYYWWFHDSDDGDPDRCPSCGVTLDTDVRWGTGKCDRCHVLV
jgi:hypothetical protein